VVTGSGTVWIGEVGRCKKPRIIKSKPESEGAKELTPEEKEAEIKQAIKKSIVLLENKLKLLEENESNTLIEFKKWFGLDDETAIGVILNRMRMALVVGRRITSNNFEEIINEKAKRETCAIVYSQDDLFKVKVGSQFWEIDAEGKESKAGIIIHELSHHENVGATEDVLYGEEDCLYLASVDPKGALKNADSFQYFVLA
jgi:hypothetical protein